jgi:hypothetical protein
MGDGAVRFLSENIEQTQEWSAMSYSTPRPYVYSNIFFRDEGNVVGDF